MKLLSRDEDTICAVSTAPGVGGLAVIRVSGPKSLMAVRGMFTAWPENPESHRVYFGTLKDRGGQELDEVLVTYFQNGKSYTGEEVVEISCHGSPTLTSAILRNLNELGARHAERGEFTYRAFMHGRLDLVQAESVLSLIESRSEQAARLALRQLKGEASRRLGAAEQTLLHVLAHLEANIDFAHEDIQIASAQELAEQVEGLRGTIRSMLADYQKGRLIKEGVRVALVGAPNVGKSSLLNALIGEERVIVSEIAGTTRDFVEVEALFDGIRFVFVDTAGLRETSDPIERLGIEKTWACVESADLVMLIRESGAQPFELEAQMAARAGERLITVMNKCDLQPTKEGAVQISARTGSGLGDLIGVLCARSGLRDFESSETLSHERHFELLAKAAAALDRGHRSLVEDASPDIVALDLQEGLWSLQELLGKQFDDQIMDRVFQQFCLGK